MNYILFRSFNSRQFFEIMLNQPTPERAIDIIWFSIVLSFCWPLPSNSSKTRVLVYKTLQISSIISACSLLLALIYAIYLHSDNILTVSECICIFMGVSQQTMQGIICVMNHDSLQVSFHPLSLYVCVRKYVI